MCLSSKDNKECRMMLNQNSLKLKNTEMYFREVFTLLIGLAAYVACVTNLRILGISFNDFHVIFHITQHGNS